VSNTAAAEATKLTENIYRAINIALVNELKVVYAAMGVDIWEVIDAAATKPFGFTPFYPGPGMGGHCIPVDPFYLTWKAREFGKDTLFIQLAGQINVAMPRLVVDELAEALNQTTGKGLKSARVLMLGIAYKRNVDDTRESPSLVMMEQVEARGAQCDFHDPFVDAIPPTRLHPTLSGRRSQALDGATVRGYDAILISTDHDNVDYELIARDGKLIIDTRNVMARLGLTSERVFKA
jgi:UDP-N-acetyl-D-glucosamine dehydrogenase